MGKVTDLHKAKEAKKDEFYTQRTDIEKELYHYKDHFKDKVVFCNCDDPEYSNFWHFFTVRFNLYGLKKLIATHYEPDGKPSYMLSMERNGDETTPVIKSLKGDGDFRSPECVELLQEADIVVTNPPFSLFREYLAQLMEYGKQFLIIGNINALTYKEVFPLIRDNRMWIGASIHSGDREFRVPDSYPLNAAGCRVDENGNKYIRVKGVRWFTNMDYPQRHEDLTLFRHYDPEIYPGYDNYDAININKVVDIPCDYDGVMGVPITFIDKYSPEQFEILGMAASAGYKEAIVGIPFMGVKDARPLIDGKNTFARIFIKRKVKTA